jgi:CRISPR-associated endoribonuclease Cas6
MELTESLSAFPVLSLSLKLIPRQTLQLPRFNKGNTLRGAFGMAFRKLVCVPQCKGSRQCPLAGQCPYQYIFEPGPPADANRLSKNQDIPRPFVFRPPTMMNRKSENICEHSSTQAGGFDLDERATYLPGEPLEFALILLGRAVDYLPYFVLAFREIARQGFGLNRALCELSEVRAVRIYESRSVVASAAWPATAASRIESETHTRCTAGHEDQESDAPSPEGDLVYSEQDQVFHQPRIPTLADWVAARLAELSPGAGELPGKSLCIRFVTPTWIKCDGQIVRQPEFHHLFKRLRDRLNSLSTFYGPGPIDADYKALGELAEKAKTVHSNVRWVERFRTSSKTHQRHELSGFTGSCIYEFPGVAYCLPSGGGPPRLNPVISEIDHADTFGQVLPWLLAGEICHVGKHAAWGNGWYEIRWIG